MLILEWTKTAFNVAAVAVILFIAAIVANELFIWQQRRNAKSTDADTPPGSGTPESAAIPESLFGQLFARLGSIFRREPRESLALLDVHQDILTRAGSDRQRQKDSATSETNPEEAPQAQPPQNAWEALMNGNDSSRVVNSDPSAAKPIQSNYVAPIHQGTLSSVSLGLTGRSLDASRRRRSTGAIAHGHIDPDLKVLNDTPSSEVLPGSIRIDLGRMLELSRDRDWPVYDSGRRTETIGPANTPIADSALMRKADEAPPAAVPTKRDSVVSRVSPAQSTPAKIISIAHLGVKKTGPAADLKSTAVAASIHEQEQNEPAESESPASSSETEDRFAEPLVHIVDYGVPVRDQGYRFQPHQISDNDSSDSATHKRWVKDDEWAEVAESVSALSEKLKLVPESTRARRAPDNLSVHPGDDDEEEAGPRRVTPSAIRRWAEDQSDDDRENLTVRGSSAHDQIPQRDPSVRIHDTHVYLD